MRFTLSALSILVICGMAFPAAAQYGPAEPTQAETALEEAQTGLAIARAERAEAIRACAVKDYNACFKLGDMYRKGDGGTQDYEKASEAYRKACDGRNGEGCAGLAYLTVYGRGMDADPVKARNLYDKSCDYGEVSGCAAYGNMLYTGQGGRKDVTQGRQRLQQACDQDYQWACDRMTELGAFQPENNTWDRLKDAKSHY